jgi:hypothetical protein
METNRTINNSMAQVSRAKGEKRTFHIYDDRFLDITIDNIFGQKNYQLNLCMLEPWPVRNRDISWRWLLSIIYFGIAALAYSIYLVNHPDTELLGRLIPFIVVFILLLLASLLMFLYRSPNVTEFRSRYCGCVLVSLLYGNPNREQFDKFVDELKQRILAASQAVRVDKHRMLINEITKLRRLRNDGVITEREYVAASKRIPNMRA